MSIFNTRSGNADGYIDNIPKHVSSELEVTPKPNQWYLNPNGLVRALEVGQEYNITLT